MLTAISLAVGLSYAALTIGVMVIMLLLANHAWKAMDPPLSAQNPSLVSGAGQKEIRNALFKGRVVTDPDLVQHLPERASSLRKSLETQRNMFKCCRWGFVPMAVMTGADGVFHGELWKLGAFCLYVLIFTYMSTDWERKRLNRNIDQSLRLNGIQGAAEDLSR